MKELKCIYSLEQSVVRIRVVNHPDSGWTSAKTFGGSWDATCSAEEGVRYAVDAECVYTEDYCERSIIVDPNMLELAVDGKLVVFTGASEDPNSISEISISDLDRAMKRVIHFRCTGQWSMDLDIPQDAMYAAMAYTFNIFPWLVVSVIGGKDDVTMHIDPSEIWKPLDRVGSTLYEGIVLGDLVTLLCNHDFILWITPEDNTWTLYRGHPPGSNRGYSLIKEGKPPPLFFIIDM